VSPIAGVGVSQSSQSVPSARSYRSSTAGFNTRSMTCLSLQRSGHSTTGD
jgi:hypothetical protein